MPIPFHLGALFERLFERYKFIQMEFRSSYLDVSKIVLSFLPVKNLFELFKLFKLNNYLNDFSL